MKKGQTCDLCFEKAEISFGITDTAVFHSCQKHAKEISDIVYPIGDKLSAAKLPLIFEMLSTPVD